MVDRLVRGIELLLALALIVAVLLNFANVIGRYGFGVGFYAADEVQTYIMVCIAFLGAAVAARRDAHLRMDVLAQRLPRPLRNLLHAAELVALIIVGSLVTVIGWQYVAQMFALGARSQTAQIPMWIPHSALAIGFALIVLLALVRVVARR